jgi:hypothetical protein
MSRPKHGPPTCHPDRPYCSNGFCKKCYELNRTRPLEYKIKKQIYDLAYAEQHKERLKTVRKQRRVENQRWYKNYKSNLACIKCGEKHIACITFHHRDVNNKVRDVSRLVLEGASLAKLIREIEKCDVLCFNCHMKEEYNVRNKATNLH